MTRPPLATPAPLEVVAGNLERVRTRIEAGGADPARVTVVAVTKGFDVQAVETARALGLRAVGENYGDELLDKVARLGAQRAGDVHWHYLGAVQRRKVRDLAPVVACWQGVTRLSEGERIAEHSPGAAVFVEVNVAGIPGRPGAAAGEVEDLVGGLRSLALDVRGLMTVGPPGGPEAAREPFRRLAALARDLDLRELSMGMTDDVEVAAAEGSTMVRVGRALFGPRPAPGP